MEHFRQNVITRVTLYGERERYSGYIERNVMQRTIDILNNPKTLERFFNEGCIPENNLLLKDAVVRTHGNERNAYFLLVNLRHILFAFDEYSNNSEKCNLGDETESKRHHKRKGDPDIVRVVLGQDPLKHFIIQGKSYCFKHRGEKEEQKKFFPVTDAEIWYMTQERIQRISEGISFVAVNKDAYKTLELVVKRA